MFGSTPRFQRDNTIRPTWTDLHYYYSTLHTYRNYSAFGVRVNTKSASEEEGEEHYILHAARGHSSFVFGAGFDTSGLYLQRLSRNETKE